jgi:hypothetical protein
MMAPVKRLVRPPEGKGMACLEPRAASTAALGVAGQQLPRPRPRLLPQSHNFRLDRGWIAEDEIQEVRIDGIEAVAETDDGGGDV